MSSAKLKDHNDLMNFQDKNMDADMIAAANSVEWSEICHDLLTKKAGILEAAFSTVTLRDQMLSSKKELASLCRDKKISLTLTNSTLLALNEANSAYLKATQDAYDKNYRYEVRRTQVMSEEMAFKEAEEKLKVLVQCNGVDFNNKELMNVLYKQAKDNMSILPHIDNPELLLKKCATVATAACNSSVKIKVEKNADQTNNILANKSVAVGGVTIKVEKLSKSALEKSSEVIDLTGTDDECDEGDKVMFAETPKTGKSKWKQYVYSPTSLPGDVGKYLKFSKNLMLWY